MERSLPQDRIWISPAMLTKSSPGDPQGTPPSAATRARWTERKRLSAAAPEFYPGHDAVNVPEQSVTQTGPISPNDSATSIEYRPSFDSTDLNDSENEAERSDPDASTVYTNAQTLPYDQWSLDSDEAYTTNSRVWVAPKTAELETWQKTRGNLQRMSLIPKSPNLPTTFSDWLQHRADFLDFQTRQMRATMKKKEELHRMQGTLESKFVEAKQPFGNYTFGDGMSPVLGERSIWSPWPVDASTYDPAPWPSIQEMKEEGDERHTSGYGRFLALPRVPGNSTVNHKQRNRVIANPLDEVWRRPVEGGTDDADEVDLDSEYMRFLLGKQMLEILKDVD